MVRIASLEDFNEILDMSIKFIETTEYKDLYDLEALEKVIETSLSSSSAVVFVEDGKGILVGQTVPFLFGNKLVAHELGWWVEPEYRKTGVGKDLINSFENWAVFKNCGIIVMTSIDDTVGEYYKKTGYKLVERMYMKEL